MMITKLISQRIHEEYRDFELALPQWLYTIVNDDLRYAIALLMSCATAFAIGMCIGLVL